MHKQMFWLTLKFKVNELLALTSSQIISTSPGIKITVILETK